MFGCLLRDFYAFRAALSRTTALSLGAAEFSCLFELSIALGLGLKRGPLVGQSRRGPREERVVIKRHVDEAIDRVVGSGRRDDHRRRHCRRGACHRIRRLLDDTGALFGRGERRLARAGLRHPLAGRRAAVLERAHYASAQVTQAPHDAAQAHVDGRAAGPATPGQHAVRRRALRSGPQRPGAEARRRGDRHRRPGRGRVNHARSQPARNRRLGALQLVILSLLINQSINQVKHQPVCIK